MQAVDVPEFGETLAPVVEPEGAVLYAPPAPSYPGYNFAGWTQNGMPFQFNKMGNKDITLTARWVKATKLPALIVTLSEDGNYVPVETAIAKYKNLSTGADSSAAYLSADIGLSETVKGEYGVAEGEQKEVRKINLAPGQFRARGQGSFGNLSPKKAFRFKFDDKQGFLGMPASRHWSLIPGIHNTHDDAMLKTDAAYSMGRALLDNLAYTARTHPVELYFYNPSGGVQEYYGVYTLSEHVRVANERLDIESEHNTTGSSAGNDTGYLLSYVYGSHLAGTDSNTVFDLDGGFRRSPNGTMAASPWERFILKSPDYDDVGVGVGITAETYAGQKAYIKKVLEDAAGVMTRAAAGEAAKSQKFDELTEFLDMPSFVDSLILHEFFRNADVGRGGFNLYKKAGDKKLYAGPPWDFDSTVPVGTSGFTVATADGLENCNPYFVWLYDLPDFKALVKARWQEISKGSTGNPAVQAANPSKPTVAAFCNGFVSQYLDDPYYPDAFAQNFRRWAGAGTDHLGPSGRTQAQEVADWKSNAGSLRTWTANRAGWLSGADAWGG
jgi:uncharacterized repeat protein (TIGR02543 family)